MSAVVRVIACGNADAGDDAAGFEAVRLARPALEGLPGVEIVEAGPGLRLLDLLNDADSVVVVDAVRTKGGVRKAGSLVSVTLPDDGPAYQFSLSSHGFGLTETVGLAVALGRVPHVVVVGVEVDDVAAGRPLSPPVRAALPDLVTVIVDEVERSVAAQEGETL
jgi:hydrogenase maturation protease